MRLIVKKSTTVWSVSIAIALLLFVVGLVISQIRPAQAQEGQGRLITIHDRGEEKVILTQAETVADALVEADVVVDVHDAVEPALDEKLVAQEYNVNIYRARPVTVIDGPIRSKIITAYQTAEQIAEDANVDLFPEDVPSLTRSDNLMTDGAGLSVTIDRATAFDFDLYGATTVARTQGETVGDMLKEKGIELGANSRASVSLDTPITPGLDVRVWREGKQTVTVEESVPFEVEEIKDADRVVGYKEVRTAGKTGLQNVTYEIVIKDGKEIARTKIAAIQTQAPEKEVVVVGTKGVTMPYTGGGSKSDWLAASNIPQESWGYADFMVQKESSWNPNALNVSSGACGLAQALPCSKIPGQWNDPVNALNWMNDYVNGRYGSWAQAYSFWVTNRWY